MIALPVGLIGVVHLGAIPGDPNAGSFAEARASAFADAASYRAGGVEQLIVENFGSVPFTKGDRTSPLPPHQVAFMTTIVQALSADGFLVGVNCLRNDARSAMGIAAAAGAGFIRVNVHTGAYVTDQGLIEGDAAGTLRYRRTLGAPVAIAADVLVKHATPLAPLDPTTATEETLLRGLADAVIVSGSGTGKPVDVDVLRTVRAAAKDQPVWIGSGLNEVNAGLLGPFVQAAIVGTSVKRDGRLSAPVDSERVRRLRDVFAAASA